MVIWCLLLGFDVIGPASLLRETKFRLAVKREGVRIATKVEQDPVVSTLDA